MPHAVLRIEGLTASPLDAAAWFHAEILPEIRKAYAGQPDLDLILAFDPAGHEHHAWRLAAVQELAREYAPARVNGVESDDDAAMAAARTYIEGAKGLTGQLLALDGKGAGPVLYGEA
jgi:hypothetical protein